MSSSWTHLTTGLVVLAGLFGFQLRPAAVQNSETGFLARAVTVGDDIYRYQVYVPNEHRRDRLWPVILWLHGAGVRGTDGLLPASRQLGEAIRRNPERFAAIVVFPQARPGHLWDDAMKSQAVAALEAATREFNGDRDRTYLIGFSMGGRGTWSLAAKDAKRFAALVVIAGPIEKLPDRWSASERETALRENEFLRSADPFAALAAKIKSLPTWLFHGSADPLAPPEESRRMSQALKNVNAVVRFTEYEGVPHEPDRALAEPELWSWLFAQRRVPTKP